MKNVFIIRPGDVGRLSSEVRNDLASYCYVCSRLPDIANLQNAANVYFVISKASMLSTAYQDLVLSALTLARNSKNWVLFLDEVPIPPGLEPLNALARAPT